MDDIVDKIKAENRIEDVVEEMGFPLQNRRGKYVRGREHDSLVINTHNQTYSWNAQGEIQGDVIEWVMKRNGWDFKGAVEFLARRAHLPEPRWGHEDQAKREARRSRETAFGLAQARMAEWLWADAEALAYARGRGWTDETIREAGLGFSGRNSAAALADLRGEFSLHEIDPECPHAVAILGFRGDVKGWAKQWGVEVGEQDNWITWKMIPGLMGKTRLVYAHYMNGRVVTFSGRNILGAEVNQEGREVKSHNLPVLLSGERQVYYNHIYGSRLDECVIVEGQADAITLGQWGIPAVAMCGTAYQDKEKTLGELRKRHQRIYIGLDADEAGEKALRGNGGDWPLAGVLGPMARVVRWPEGKDANDWLKAMVLVNSQQPIANSGEAAAEELGESAEGGDQAEAVGKDSTRRMVQWQAKQARETLDRALTIAEEMAAWVGGLKGGERDKGLKLAFKVISQMDGVERATYRQSLIGKLGIGIREFADILKGAVKESEEEPVAFVETLGGFIEGWLVEYVYDPVADKVRLAFRDPEKKIGVAEYLDIKGKRYVPKAVNNFIKEGGVLFPSEIGALKSTRELVTLVEMFINSHYLLENRYLSRIISYYVLMTWCYDAFNALPYLRAMGDAGAGKSELMRRVGHLCYRLMMASGAGTAASFFRATEMYRGTVFIDEADLHDGGDMSNDLVKFLNLGAMAGNPIWRLEEVITEGGKTYEVVTFKTFCPKLIAMRKDFRDDAVGSRCLTIKVQPREPMELRAKGIKLNIDDEFRERARAIRNLLLRWRFEHWEAQIETGDELMDMEISSRLNQVTMPLKALAKDDPELIHEIETFLRGYHQEITLTKSMTIAARVVEALWRIYRNSILHEKYISTGYGGESVLIGDVALIANQIMDEMNALGEDEEEDEGGKRKRKKDSLTARGVGSIIRNELQLQVGDRRGKGFPVFWDEMRMRALAKRYGIDPDAKVEVVELNKEKKSAEKAKQNEIPF